MERIMGITVDNNAIRDVSKDGVFRFAIEEYNALRAEIIERSKMDHALQRNAVLVTGAISSWVFSRPPNPLLAFVLLIIPIVLLIAHFQQARHKAYGMKIGKYIKRLEGWIYAEINRIEGCEKLGWELFLEGERGGERKEDMSYYMAVKRNLTEKGYSLSATVVDARYLTVGAMFFLPVAIGYFVWAFNRVPS
jgi:hypothetical protein